MCMKSRLHEEQNDAVLLLFFVVVKQRVKNDRM